MITPADSAPTAPEQMPASSFDIQAPYVTGALAPIAGASRDDMASSVTGAQAAAEARYGAHESDTHGLGSQLGTPVTLPVDTTTGSDGGAYYDPPRSY